VPECLPLATYSKTELVFSNSVFEAIKFKALIKVFR